jgi:hypothetical protein
MTWFYGQVRNRGPWDYKQVKLLEDGGTVNPASPFEKFRQF